MDIDIDSVKTLEGQENAVLFLVDCKSFVEEGDLLGNPIAATSQVGHNGVLEGAHTEGCFE